MRASIAILALLLAAPTALAQGTGAADAGTPAAPTPPEATPAPGAAAAPTDAAPPPAAPSAEPVAAAPEAGVPLRTAPKVAVIVVGDPDPILVAAAREIEARLSIAAEVRLPADASLRSAMHGDAGADGDGLEEVRGDRRRLGGGEASDAPILQRLGRRAGAVAVIAVRATEQGPEAVALDVRTAQFFEGTLALGEPDADAIATFVARRARTSARAAAAAGPAAETEGGVPTPAQVAEGATQPTEEDDGQSPGEWMEQNWPYFAAGALLVAAIVFVAVTATQGDPPPPMLRFQPGTP